jgi:hypothetical protein
MLSDPLMGQARVTTWGWIHITQATTGDTRIIIGSRVCLVYDLIFRGGGYSVVVRTAVGALLRWGVGCPCRSRQPFCRINMHRLIVHRRQFLEEGLP